MDAGAKRPTGGSLLFAVSLATAVTAVLDLVHLHILSPQRWWPSAPMAWAGLALWEAAFGAALLPAVAALETLAEALSRRLSRLAALRGRAALAAAIAPALLLSPALAFVSWSLFQGRGVSQLAWAATLGPPVTFLVGGALVVGAWRLLGAAAGAGPLARAAAWAATFLLVAGLFLADARLYVGLYDLVHLSLSALVVLALIAAGRTLPSRPRRDGPTTRRARAALLGAASLVTALALIALATMLRLAPATRADLVERTLYASRGIALLARVLPFGARQELTPMLLTFEEIERHDLGELAPPPTGERPDLLLLSIDAVNADRFPGRGYQREVMPTVAALLPRAVRFDRAYTTVPETQYALPGLVMSTTRDLGPAAAVRESGETIASALRRAGYETAWVYEARDLFRGGGVLNNLEFDGFDARYGVDDDDPFAISDRVAALLDTERRRPLFLWAHLFAPHAPYSPPPEFRRFGTERSDLYDGELLLTDELIRRILDALRERGRLGQTVVVITSDHGEWTGEGGRFGHGADVRERTVNVPLLMMGPGIAPGRVVSTPVSLLDVGPTLLELVGTPVPDSFEGQSLAPLLRGSHEPFDRGVVVTRTEGHELTAAILGDDKLVFNQTKTVVRLYDLAHDRGETRDLSALEPGRVRELLARVAARDLERAVTERVARDGAAAALALYTERATDPAASMAERILAARAFGYVGAPGTPAALLDLLDEVSLPRPLRQWLAHSLARRGAGAFGPRALRRARRDGDTMVRALLVRSLRATDHATEALEAWVDDPSVHLRRAAATLVSAEDGRARPDRPTSERLLADEDPRVRALAVGALERLDVPDRDAAVLRALDDREAIVRLAAAARCERQGTRCLDAALQRLEALDDVAERLALLRALRPALDRQPSRWAALLDGPPEQRALAYEGLAASSGEQDERLVERLERERDPRALEALIHALGERRVLMARRPLLRLIPSPNRALGLAATDALLRVGLSEEDVGLALDLLGRTRDLQIRLDLTRALASAPRIDDPRAWSLLEALRRTPRKDHHLIRALVSAYSRLGDERAERFRVDYLHYDNFGYHFWLYGVRLTPAHPRPGDEVVLRTLWSIRWQQPADARNVLRVSTGGAPHTLERQEVAGGPVNRWPTCRIMIDETRIAIPADATRLRITTAWRRNGRWLPLVYGERADDHTAVVVDMDLTED